MQNKPKFNKRIKHLFWIFSMIGLFGIPFIISQEYSVSQSSYLEHGQSINSPFGICHGYGYTSQQATELKDQGVSITRNDLYWENIERSYNLYDFTYHDQFYTNLESQSIETLAILDYGNPNLYGNNYQVYISPIQIPHWLEYVNACVQRYQTIIDYWEIWNEPNLDKFWNGSDVEFFSLLNLTAFFIKSIDQNLKIISPGISGHDPEYLEAMISYIGDSTFNSLFSALNYHPYSGASAELITSKAESVKAVAKEHNFAGQIWITEVGYSTQVSGVNQVEIEYRTSWNEQGRQLVKIFAQALAEETDIIVWYSYRDAYPMNWTYGEAAFGIQHYWDDERGLEYKPAGYAFRYLSKSLTHGTYYPDGLVIEYPILTDTTNLYAYYFYSNRNTTIIIIWAQSMNYQMQLTFQRAPSEFLFDIMVYNYFDNSYQNTTNVKKYSTNLSNNPIILELNYTRSIDQFMTQHGPFPFIIKIDYIPKIKVILIFVPSIGVIAIIAQIYFRLRKNPL